MKILDRLEEWIIASLMAGATFIIFIAVLHRYLSGLPIPGVQDWLIAQNTSWAQELSTFMFVWMAKFGAAYGVRTGIHVGVDVIIRKLTGTPQKALMPVHKEMEARVGKPTIDAVYKAAGFVAPK